jgi:Flp pilus assembly protein TadG
MARRPDEGSAIVEFVMVAVLLLMLLFGVIQVAVYLHVRDVVAASAVEGARYGALAGVDDPQRGAERTLALVRSAVGTRAAAAVRCTGSRGAAAGLPTVRVRCTGELPPVFAPAGGLLPIDVSAEAVAEVP